MKMDIRVQCFGALSRFGREHQLSLDADSTVADLRRQLVAELGPEASGLLERCAVANDERLLHRGEPLRGQAELALLPPVSGG